MIHELTPERFDHVTEVIVAAKHNVIDQLAGNPMQFTINLGVHLVELATILLQGSIAGFQDGIFDKSIPIALVGTVILACTELCEVSSSDITEAKLDILEKSILGRTAPLAFAYVEHWLNTNTDVHDVCPQLIPLATNLLAKLQPLYSVVKERETFMQTKHQGTHSIVFESDHEYRNDMHEMTEVHLDGATSIKITFDDRSRTEYNYDYLVFYTDKSCTTYHGEEKYSGRDTSYNWPGVGGNPPLVIHSDRCFVLFHTDGSNTDWGYKFTATAEITEQSKSFEQHWITSLEGNILDCLGLIIEKESTWFPTVPQEVSNARFLESDLFHGGYLIDAETPPDDVLAFLYELIELEDSDGVAARIAQRLKANTLQDQGAVPHINRAVRAVAAAILHHNMWSLDAYALSQGIQHEPSMPLLRAWKNAQKMRNWFDMGDAQRPILAASTSIDESRPTLQRQPSAYSGASEDALRTLCSNVVARAKFLLQLSPASFSLATSEDPTAAAKRWNLLAKYGVALKKSDNPASILEKWHSLVDEVEAATELKKMMLYRKTSAGRHHGKHEKTMTELVLEFVQSDVDVPDIVEAVNMRNRRAAHRSLSVSILHNALVECQNPRLSLVLLERFASTLYSLETRKVNLFNQLHGCSIVHRNAIRELYASVLKMFAKILMDPTSTLHQSVLKCFALDFDPKDGDIIFDSQIVASAFKLLFSQDMSVRDAAQAAVRILIDRFIRKDKETNIQRDIVRGIKDYVRLFERPSTSMGVYLPSNTPGLSRLTCRPVPTITFWMYIPSLEEVRLCVGDQVKQGPNWKTSLDEDDYGIGTVMDVFNDTEVSIKWLARPGGKEITASYVYDPSSSVYEIVPASLDVGGQIFLKSKAFADSWRNRLFGLYLSSDYKLELSLSVGADAALKFTSSKALKAANWHHVTVTPQESNIVVRLDGEEFVQAELSSHFAQQSVYDARMLESEHPYVKQGWQYYKLSVPGASLLRIKFDAQTSTGSNANSYLVIYQNEEHSLFYGEERYCSAESNFPGVQDNSPFEIPSGSFIVGMYKGDNTDDFWGFRLHAYVVEGSDVSPESRLYLGEAPTRIIPGIQSARCFIYDLKVLDSEPSASTAAPDECPASVRLQDIWHILGCIHTILSNGSNIYDLISSAIPWLLELVYSASNPANLRFAASNTITQTITSFPNAIEHSIFEPYIEKSFDFLSQECNMWNSGANHELLELSTEHKNLLALAYSGILRSAYEIPALAPKIEAKVREGLKLSSHQDNYGPALASALVLGGDYDGIFIGSPVKCVVKNENQEPTLESGWVIDIKVVGTVRFARVLYDLYLNRIESIPVKNIVLSAPYGENGKDTNELLSRCFEDVVNAAVNESPPTPPQMDLQTRLLKVLSNMDYKALHNGNFQSILPKLLRLAQRPSNEALVPVKSIKKSFESTHPYRESLDIYETISFPHAKSLRVIFSSATRTEKDCDYIIFYKDKVDRELWWGDDKYSGRDGDENFPGYNDRPPLIIPASEFTFYWHTDSSNNDWGWEFTVEAVFEPMAASTLTLQQLQQRVYHLSEVLLDVPAALSTAEPVCRENNNEVAEELWALNKSLASLPQLKYLGGNHETQNWIIVNKMGAMFYNSPEFSTSSNQSIPYGTIVKVTQQTTNWFSGVDWKGGAQEWMVCSDQLPTLSEGRVDAWLSEYAEKVQLSRELVVNESNGILDMESHFDTSTIYAATVCTPLRLHCILLDSLIKRYALLFVRLYIEAQSDDAIPCEVFLQLVQLTIASDTSANTSGILGSQLRKYASKNNEFLESVLNVTTNTLLEVVQTLTSVHSFVRVVENMRPNTFERIHFPGAREIRIEFDESTHCDEEYAHVSFYDRDGAAGEEPYHGSSKGGNWPGLNKRPPLIVQTDYIMVYFYMSSGDADSTRIKFTAYGETSDRNTSEVESTKPMERLKLVLWIWSQFSDINVLRPQNLPNILDVLCQLYHFSPSSVQRNILAVWSNWLQYDRDWFFDHLSSLQIHRFMSFIKFKLWVIHDREGANDKKSLVEQRLLQCVLDADLQLENYALQLENNCDLLTEFTWETKSGVQCNGNRVEKAESGCEIIVSTVEGCKRGRHRWYFFIHRMSKHLVVGLTIDGSPDIKHEWAPKVENFGEFFARDTLTLELDYQAVRYYRNGSYCGQSILLPGEVYRPAVKLVDCGDAILIQKQPPLQWLRELQARNPVWYQRITSIVAMLMGFNGQMRNQDT
ncbi:HECT E3 ubiquitin ligase, partial [Thraustotheca clavata]